MISPSSTPQNMLQTHLSFIRMCTIMQLQQCRMKCLSKNNAFETSDCRSSTQCEENCRGCNRCNCGCALAFEFIIVETYEVAGVEGMSAWYLAGSLTSWRVVAGLLVGQSQFVHAYAAVTTIVIVLHRLKLMQWKGLLHAKCSKK